MNPLYKPKEQKLMRELKKTLLDVGLPQNTPIKNTDSHHKKDDQVQITLFKRFPDKRSSACSKQSHIDKVRIRSYMKHFFSFHSIQLCLQTQECYM